MPTRPIVAATSLCVLAVCHPAQPQPDVTPEAPLASSFEPSERSSDVAITAAIRRQILATEGLAAQGDSVRIRTEDGTVTLRGLVDSTAERDRIVSIAERIAGVDRVEDQLEVLDGER